MCSSTLALQQTNKHSAGHTNKQTRLHIVGYVLLHFSIATNKQTNTQLVTQTNRQDYTE